MIGETVSHYRITAALGGGQMGDVYKAVDTRLERTVALKFLAPELLRDDTARKRFIREAKAAASIDHSNVCHVYGINELPDGRMFIAMAYCDGQNLHKKIEQGRIPVADAVSIAADIAAGLAAAHSHKVIHRDLKPSNLMVARDGTARIVDFGLARLVDKTRMTATGMTLGTLMYMSPEQARGEQLDGRSDIFSLGIVLYEMVAGEPPFFANQGPAVLYKIVNETYEPVRKLRPEAPASLALVIDRALEKDRDDRYQTAEEFVADLLKVLEEVDPNRIHVHHKAPNPIKEFMRRHGRRVAAATTVIALGALAWQFFPARTQENGLNIAVIAHASGGGESEILAAGFAADLAQRLQRLSCDRPEVWAIPPSQARRTGVQDPADAPGLSGADLVIQTHAPSPEHPVFGLEVYRPASEQLEVAHHIEFDWPAGPLRQAALDSLLCALLEAGEHEPAAATHTNDFVAYRAYLMGLGHLAAGAEGNDAAATMLEFAVTLDSTFAEAWAALAETDRRLARAGNADKMADAQRCAHKALEIDTTLADAVRITLARMMMAEQKLPEAIHEFQRALLSDPRHPDALRALGDAYAAAGQPDHAEESYAAAVAANPANIDAHVMLGYHYYVNERYLEAVAPFERVTRIAPGYAETYNYLGACYFALECWDNAATAFQRSFDLNRSYFACSNLGTLFYYGGRFEDAARMYEWAVEYAPSHYQTVGHLADACYWIPEQRERSIQLYTRAVELAEEAGVRALDDAGQLMLLCGYYSIVKPDSASDLMQRALALAPDDPDIQWRVASVYALLNEPGKALVHLGRSLDLGYSLKHIESEPFLAELREDPRYGILVEGVETKVARCEPEV